MRQRSIVNLCGTVTVISVRSGHDLSLSLSSRLSCSHATPSISSTHGLNAVSMLSWLNWYQRHPFFANIHSVSRPVSNTVCTTVNCNLRCCCTELCGTLQCIAVRYCTAVQIVERYPKTGHSRMRTILHYDNKEYTKKSILQQIYPRPAPLPQEPNLAIL